MADTEKERKRLEEIFDINRRFVDLIAQQAGRARGGGYGLPEELCAEIKALKGSQRDVVAGVPLLLVTVTSGAVEQASAVRETEPAAPRKVRGHEVAEQVFGAALMTWLTQDAQQNHTLSSLWLGAAGQEGEPVRDLNFGDIQGLAPHSRTILRARFADRPGVWSDLLEAARSGDPQRQHLARLAVLPQSYPLRRKTGPGSWRRR